MSQDTLPGVLTAQSLFDDTVRHLASMPRQSRAGSNCVYRGPDGLKCAVGHHLTDEECSINSFRTIRSRTGWTHIDQLGTRVSGLKTHHLLPERLVPFVNLLQELQKAHDNTDTGAWDMHGCKTSVMRENLRIIADEFNLNRDILDELGFPAV